jgi:hypothetical protein
MHNKIKFRRVAHFGFLMSFLDFAGLYDICFLESYWNMSQTHNRKYCHFNPFNVLYLYSICVEFHFISRHKINLLTRLP